MTFSRTKKINHNNPETEFNLAQEASTDQPIEQEAIDPSLSLAEYAAKSRQKAIVFFPLTSLIAALLTIGFLILSTNAELSDFYSLPHELSQPATHYALFALVAIVILFDARRYKKKKRRAIAQWKDLQNYLEKVWQSKKKQQQKANTYSSHAEKLKLFISDKLLEYIEYDEKFLHFKGIASEVRHNGVISYDKIMTALHKAIEQQGFLAIYEQNDDAENTTTRHSLDSLSQYQSAIDALRYLWDLLDLSTADNMALHIGNQLIECEEHYYQLNLDADKKLDITQTIPQSPTFHPQLSAMTTLSLFTDEIEIHHLIAMAKINEKVLHDPFVFDNPQFRVRMLHTPELLGNANHIILLLENLIKNAQFFSQKAKYRQKSDRIGISLKPGDGFAHFTIYNRGPLIDEQNLEKIFQLGFSTRRSKDYHGKGLGLFFANEIVKGYQGKIKVSNCRTTTSQFHLTVSYASGESQTYRLEILATDNKLQVREEDQASVDEAFTLSSDIPIVKVAIMRGENQPGKAPHKASESTLLDIDPTEPVDWLDPDSILAPDWRIQISAFRKHHRLIFSPLDIDGVQFDIFLPTADSRLNEQEIDFSDY